MTPSTQWQLAQEAAERYEEVLVPAILGPAAKALVKWAGLRSGMAVVDLGCGTGAATFPAAVEVGSAGRVTGVDVNGGMLAVARARRGGIGEAGLDGSTVSIEWHQGSLVELPFDDESFDAALCAQTLQFLPDKSAALVEAARVLRPGGRLSVSLWCGLSESPYFEALVEAVAAHIGVETAAGLGAAFRLTKEEGVRQLFIDAGFSSFEVELRRLELPLPPLEDFVPWHIGATPMAGGFAAASAASRRAVVQEVGARLEPFRTVDGAFIPFGTWLIRGSKV